MRDIIIRAIINTYLQDRSYGMYLDKARNATERHHEICEAINRLTDDMILSVYQRCLVGNMIIVVWSKSDGQYADIYCPSIEYYGGMTSDGTIHT